MNAINHFKNPETDQWPLYSSPLPTVIILAFYSTFALYLGPKMMKNRKPLNLLWVIRVYNVFQISHNLFLLITGVTTKNYFGVLFSFGCKQLSPSESADFAKAVDYAFWQYYINKVLDLLDTIFFVLRKKQSHVTFLHVYHHISMVILTFGVGKYFAGVEPQFTGLINIIIHIFMYSYYTISSFGSLFTFHLKYKKFLTKLQIIQFLLVLVHSMMAHYLSCGFNLIVVKFFIFEAAMNLVLFMNFYRKTYGSNRIMPVTMCTPLQLKDVMNGSELKTDQNDKIVDEWPLLGSPAPILTILISYIIFVLYLGPRFMKNRKPFDLRWVIRIFNICNIGHNLYMIIGGFMEPNYTGFLVTFGCLNVSPATRAIFVSSVKRGYWHYFLNKVFDLLDTIFFVLRKKQSHVTFLHVYHHASMVLIMYVIGKYFPGMELAFAGVVNACIHVCMYIYYTIASFGDIFQGHLKFKKYLTVLQICQFLAILINGIVAHYISCGYNLMNVKLIMFESIVNLVLFINFYRKAYGRDRLGKMTKMMICTPLQMREGIVDGKKEKVVDENQNEVKKDDESDSPVIDNWFLFDNPIPIISIAITYVVLMKFVGPKYMANRKPYDLLWVIRIYNLCQIGYNLFMLIRSFFEPGYISNFLSFGCASFTTKQAQMFEYNVFRGHWHYLMNKMLDLLDTAFFVLRKKQSHVTFLHVFHHVSMIIIVWIILKYHPGQAAVIAAFINAVIHVLMYSYYFLSSFGQTFGFVYRLKKYLTIAQIGQFVLVLIYYSLALKFSCGFNMFIVRLIFFEAIANLCLFINFYRKTYGTRGRLDKAQRMMICTPLQHQENRKGSEQILDENQNVKRPDVVDKYFLMGSPLPLIGILIGYVGYVCYFGPRHMRNKKPYELENIIILYNLFQMCYNMYMVYLKQNQVTVLHVYHHVATLAITWALLKYYPGHEPAIVGILNSIVHSVMYLYYTIAAMGPKYRKYLWWKRYITWMQMTQFLIILCYNSIGLYRSCEMNLNVLKAIMVHAFINLLMFMNFYYHAYIKPERHHKKEVREINRNEMQEKKLNSIQLS
uniref:Elongation of very long chain fatty acids protein n=1 Tax=Culicoides sonorensis TaxID=179676 RepID=A0A336LMV5_CULSO